MAAGLLLSVTPSARAQQPVQPDTTRPKTAREIVLERLRTQNRAEVRDTSARDTLALDRPQQARPQQPAMEFAQDSIMRSLMQLEGFASTQYRGSSASFAADSNRLVLYGTKDQKAGVVREGQVMVADSLVTFDENSGIACGYGKPEITGASDAPISGREMCYDTRRKLAMAVGARTQVSEGANWFVTGDLYYKDGNAYGHDGQFTDCTLEEPHYHFAAGAVKIVQGDVMVARNVTLNFGDVPVFWLPFMMQSMKRGRRSGILMPQFSINDIVRRNSNYNRRISDVGFYWAINDNLGSQLSLDWWSDNYTALEASFDYNFLGAFMNGGATVKRFWRSGGAREFTVAAQHSWEPSERTSLRMDAQYASSTDFIEERSYDPRELRRQIISNAGLSRRFDWGSVSMQASRNQDLSTDRVDYTLPSLGVTFATVTLFPATGASRFYNNATWTSSAQFRRTAIDEPNTDLDPSGMNANVSSSFNMGRLSWSQSFDSNLLSSAIGDSASRRLITGQKMGWRTSLNFQQNLIGTSTFTPGISISQDLLRNDTLPEGNRLYSAPMRLDVNAALKMDIFGFWPGIGSIERIRHRMSPTISYSYAPAVSLDTTDIRSRVFGRLNALERNTISIGLSQTFEGKYKEDEKREGELADSAAIDSTTVDPSKPRRLPQARKVTILSLGTDAVIYDFVAGRRGDHGIQTTQISNSINSDLLRGLQLTLTHDLFKGGGLGLDPSESEEREFAPHLRRVSASFSLSNNSFLFRMFGLGKKTDAAPATGSAETPTPTQAQGGPNPSGAPPEMGLIGNRERNAEAAPSRGPLGSWNASFNLTLERPREEEQIDEAEAPPSIFNQGNEMMTMNFSFQPTQQWNVQWSTGFSFSDNTFSDHILTFTRQMHDWDANFNFMKAQNGNFSFVFNVKLRANPDIKFDYQQRSNVRNER